MNQAIKTAHSARHIPDHIFEIKDVSYLAFAVLFFLLFFFFHITSDAGPLFPLMFVFQIPLTANGKKTELAVKSVVSGNQKFKPSSVSNFVKIEKNL